MSHADAEDHSPPRWVGQGGSIPPSGGSTITVTDGDQAAWVAPFFLILFVGSLLGIVWYNRRQRGEHLLRTWVFYFDWVFACLVGVTWAELLLVLEPDNYTTLWIVGVYSVAGTIVYPALSILFSARFFFNYGKLDARPKKESLRARFSAGLDILLSASFGMADSVSHSLLLNVWVEDYLAVDSEPSDNGPKILFWLGIALAITVAVMILRALCCLGIRAAKDIHELETAEESETTQRGSSWTVPPSLLYYLEQFCLVTKASFGTTMGWMWNYLYYVIWEVINTADSTDFWRYYGPRTLVAVVLFPLLELLVPTPSPDRWLLVEMCCVLHGICVVTCAYVLADFAYYLTMDHVANASNERWGQLALWAVTMFSCLVTPPLCWLLGGDGWSAQSERWWLKRLQDFWIEELQWFASYNIWYAWWAAVGDLADQTSSSAFGYRALLALGLSLAPGAAVMAVWLLRHVLFTGKQDKGECLSGQELDPEMDHAQSSKTTIFLHNTFSEIRRDFELLGRVDTEAARPKPDMGTDGTLVSANPLCKEGQNPKMIAPNDPSYCPYEPYKGRQPKDDADEPPPVVADPTLVL